MFTQPYITETTEQVLAQDPAGDLFLVEVHVRGANDIEIVLDADSGMTIDRCVTVSRAIQAEFVAKYGEEADFSLTVFSAGVGQPLLLLRQYQKLLRRDQPQVDVLYADGRKLTAANLVAATEQSITIEYQTKELLEGKKRKELVNHREEIPLAQTKSVSEHLNIK